MLSDLSSCVRPSIVSVLEKQFKISQLTPVQSHCIPAFVSHKDVIVQSPTGSGKTLAYLVPLFEILSRQKWKKWQVGALILVPNRELAVQVSGVASHFAPISSLRIQTLVGGAKIGADVEKFKAHGANIIIATPGRLEELLSHKLADFQLSGHMRAVEVLVIDEADRLMEMGFSVSISSILSHLPKQRRTGLFSATQAKEMEDILKFGLRNPSRISIEGGDDVTPETLRNYYAVVPFECKLRVLLDFIKQHSREKILVFLSTCACVDYFGSYVRAVLKNRPLFTLHGRKRNKRQNVFEKFSEAGAAVMLSTDVMARGVDVSDIDWVVQFDPPKQANWFVHRAGRTGRSGREGDALVLLTQSEEGYVDFLEIHENLRLESMQLECSTERAEHLRLKMVKMATKDRNFLEKGTRAFVSYIQSYSKHDCHLVCSLKELDVVNAAHCYGLLRLPRMPELRGRDLSTFKRSEIDTAQIKFKDKDKESKRKSKTERRRMEAAEKSQKRGRPETKEKRKRKTEKLSQEDIDDLSSDIRLMKKFKKGKMSKDEFDEQFMA